MAADQRRTPDGYDRERPERRDGETRAPREGRSDLDRYRSAQRNQRYQVRKPTQGTWYERPASERPRTSGSAERGQRSRSGGTSPQRATRYSDLRADGQAPSQRQHGAETRSRTRSAYTQQQLDKHAPTMANYDSRRHGYAREQELAHLEDGFERRVIAPDSQRSMYVRIGIIAVLLVILVVRTVTFGAGNELSGLNSQIADQQAQLQTLTDSNTTMQSQIDSWQTTIDAYNKKESSSSSSS